MSENYRVDLDLFAGPLDLLLHLVRKSEIAVGEVALARIASQFMSYLDAAKALDLEAAGDFLAIASMLIEIKAREALPREEEAPEEAESEPDIGQSDLIRRLLEYRRFKEAAAELENRAASWQQRYPRLSIEQPVDAADPLEDRIREVELWDLVSGLGRAIQKKQQVGTASMKREEIPVALLVEQIGERVRREGRIAFTGCFSDREDRDLIVGTFLAILELVRHHGFRAEQPELNGEIWISPPADAASHSA